MSSRGENAEGIADSPEAKLDPQLRFVAKQEGEQLERLASLGSFALTEEQPSQARILVRSEGDPGTLADAGMEVATVAGDVVSGTAPVDALPGLAGSEGVRAIEGARPLSGELDLSIPDCHANAVHTGPPGHRGSGVIVGIVDSGVDWLHENFRAADSSSRILSIWDQSLVPQGGEAAPAGFPFGVEYGAADIDAAFGDANPRQRVRHRDPAGHGTHVAGIAAGDGSAAGQGKPAGSFVGVAPEADLIVVGTRGGGERGMGDSASALQAVDYVFKCAAALGRPAVVNMSLGDNLGAHDGSSLLERGLDNLLSGPGQAMVKSAGNAGADGIHARGTLAAGASETVGFAVRPGDPTLETIDVWYAGSDRFDVKITTPGGSSTAAFSPGASEMLGLPNGNQLFVDSSLNDPNNGANRIFLTISSGSAGALEGGAWSLTLAGTTVTNGRFDAWIQRGSMIARFQPPHEDPEMTISTPGTGAKMITVACYMTRGDGASGAYSEFSSRGPTRDGRPAPDVAAPGEVILSAHNEANGADPYVGMRGTSMAAPHVTGAVALMLQKDRGLTQSQIKDHLRSTARSDGVTGAVPNISWGAGKLDTAAAFAAV
jgi:subtilisin family serine protease